MFLYIVKGSQVNTWEINAGSSYEVSNDLLTSDIYIDEDVPSFTVKPLEEGAVEFVNKPEKAFLRTNQGDIEIEGNLTQVSDMWVRLGETLLIFSNKHLDLNPGNIDQEYSNYLSSVNYYSSTAKENIIENLEEPLEENIEEEGLEEQIETQEEEYDTSQEDNYFPEEEDLVESKEEDREESFWDEEEEEAAQDELLEDEGYESEDLEEESIDHEELDEENDFLFEDEDEESDELNEEDLAQFNEILNENIEEEAKPEVGSPAEEQEIKKITEGDQGLSGNLKEFFKYLVDLFKRRLKLVLAIIFAIISISIAVSVMVPQLLHKHEAKVEQVTYQRATDVVSNIGKVMAEFKVINYHLYRDSGSFVIFGVVDHPSKIQNIQKKLQSEFPAVKFTLNIVTKGNIQQKLNSINKLYNLSCNLSKDVGFVKCIGMVKNKDSIQEEVLEHYQYNNIVPIDFTLYYASEVQNAVEQILSENEAFKNLKFNITNRQIIFSGYLNRNILHVLMSQVKDKLLTQMNFITVVYKIKVIEDYLNIKIKQVLFSAYGNSFIDQNDNEYGIGSKCYGFIVRDIQKNFIVFSDGENDIVYYTPFNNATSSDKVTVKADSNFAQDNSTNSTDIIGGVVKLIDNSLSNSSSSSAILKPKPSIQSSSPSRSANLGSNRNAILSEELEREKRDINHKKAILQELQEASKVNPSTINGRSYAELMENIKSDIALEEREISVAEGNKLKN